MSPKVDWAGAPFAEPILGTVDGHPVLILQNCEVAGYSPCQHVRDLDGDQHIVPLERVRSTDPRQQVLLNGLQQQQQAFTQSQQGQQYDRR
jgi:hypothetical protein